MQWLDELMQHCTNKIKRTNIIWIYFRKPDDLHLFQKGMALNKSVMRQQYQQYQQYISTAKFYLWSKTLTDDEGVNFQPMFCFTK